MDSPLAAQLMGKQATPYGENGPNKPAVNASTVPCLVNFGAIKVNLGGVKGNLLADILVAPSVAGSWVNDGCT